MKRWSAALGPEACKRLYPLRHDINDMLTAGDDLNARIASADTERDPAFAGPARRTTFW